MKYGWVKIGDGHTVYRRISETARTGRSDFPTPMVMGDTFHDAVQSMADGNYYTSKAALRATYQARNNPQGIRYHEVGNEIVPHSPKYESTIPPEVTVKEVVDKLGI